MIILMKYQSLRSEMRGVADASPTLEIGAYPKQDGEVKWNQVHAHKCICIETHACDPIAFTHK